MNGRFPIDKIKAVIFDLDGTLIDSAYVWKRIDEEFLAKRGFEVPPDYAKKISCLNFQTGALYTIERFGLKERAEDIIDEWFQMAVHEYRYNIKMNKDAARFLRDLKAKGIKLALATASSPALYNAVLENNDVAECFDAFTSTEEVCRSKEHPDVYILAAGKLGCAVSECAVFEDIAEGVISAKSAGFYVCAYIGNNKADNPDNELMRKTADLTIGSYESVCGEVLV